MKMEINGKIQMILLLKEKIIQLKGRYDDFKIENNQKIYFFEKRNLLD